MKKLLIVNTKSGPYGGVESYIQKMNFVLKESGFQLYGLFEDAICSEDNTFYEKCFSLQIDTIDKLYSKILQLKIDTVIIHKVHNFELLSFVVKRFYSIAIIHDHDYYCSRRHKYFPFTRKICNRSYNKLFCSICSCMVKKNQGQYELLKPNLEENFLKVIRNANKFIVLSHYMKNNLIENKFNKDKIELIYPYIRNEKRKNIDRKKTSHRFKILFVGQIIRGKGLDLLIQAVSKVRGDWELNIVGKGNDELFIRHTVSKYGLSNRVHFVGWMEDPSIFYQQSDVLVFPSRWPEPFGLVGLEAFSYNVPVVAFNIGGISEWLVDGENGYCIPPFDLTEMALKIEKLRDDADLRNEMGNTGYNWVEKYTNFEVYQKQIVSILETKEANSLTST